MNKLIPILALALTGCAAANVPDALVYETSLRGEQGWSGTKARDAAAADLLRAGVITDPLARLESALPQAEIDLRQYGLRYADENWNRYRVVLDADIVQGREKTRCRLVSPEKVDMAPTLAELTANGGALLEAGLQALTTACIFKVQNPDG